jgi:hypothetical protein
MRLFLITTKTKKLSEDEAISLMTIAVDFGITQVVHGIWGVHVLASRPELPPERHASWRNEPAVWSFRACPLLAAHCSPL